MYVVEYHMILETKYSLTLYDVFFIPPVSIQQQEYEYYVRNTKLSVHDNITMYLHMASAIVSRTTAVVRGMAPNMTHNE